MLGTVAIAIKMSAPKGKGKQTVVKTATEIDIVLPVERDFVPGKISFKEW